MKKKVLSLYHFFEQKPLLLKSLLAILFLLFIVCVSHIHFSENISDFLPQKENNQRINEAYQHIGTTNKILVTISTNDTTHGFRQRLTTYADEFVELLQQNDTATLTSNIFYKVVDEDITNLIDFIVKNEPYFLQESDYKRIDSLLIDDNMLRNELQWNRNMLFSPSSKFLQNIIFEDPLHLSNSLLKDLNALQQSNSFHQFDGYIFNSDETELLITLTSETSSSESAINKQWIEAIEKTAVSIEKNHENDCQITHIGAAEISIGNADQLKFDTIFTSIIAIILIAMLLWFFYKDLRAIGLIFFSLLFGLLMALAFLAIFKDSVSLIAVGIGSIIVGIAVNYPLHFLAHLKGGNSREETIREIVSPLIIGNITTVGAFISLLFISSDAMHDMGWFAALLLIGTILFVLIFLPHLYREKLFNGKQSDKLLFGVIAKQKLEDKKVIVLGVIILSIPLYFFSLDTQFETDLHKINYMTNEQRSELEKLIKETEDDYDKTYCICEGKCTDEALQQYEAIRSTLDSLKETGMVEKELGIGIFSPSSFTQESRIKRWNDYWSENKDILIRALTKIGEEQGFQKEFFDPFIEKISKPISSSDTIDFTPIRKTLTENYIYEGKDKTFIYTILKSKGSDTRKIVNALQGKGPNVFTFDNQSLFSKMIENLSSDFNHVLYICAFIVFFFLLFSYGRLELSLLAFLPLTIGWIWILGIMNLLDIRFNIVNIILATFIFGQGDDYTIFVTEGLMYEYAHGKKVLASYKNSVFLSACIMFIGIGALIFAQHPAMKSLAEVTIVGMSCVILMSYLFPPLLFKWLTESNGKKRLMPITFRNLLNTFISFVVFLIGSIALSLAGFVLLTLGGKTEEHKLRFHRLIRKTFEIMARLIPGVSHHLHNDTNYQFDKPCILISNHQSHLDLMYTLMLHPKIICLTNDWVWNSPFYGRIIRYAEFFPVSNGIETSIDTLKSAVERGYSILIFPEGTRSEDCSILRFHQGAFYLANKLNLDIVPLLIHGIGHVFPKTEFLLRKGRIDVKILPPVTPDDPIRLEKEPRQIAQSMRHYYQEEYARLTQEVETPDYFKDLVYHNYIYKGADVIRETRRILSDPSLNDWIEQLPDTGEIELSQCGQGEKVLLASLVKKNLHITAFDEDEDKLSIAQNCASIPQNLTYKKQDKSN